MKSKSKKHFNPYTKATPDNIGNFLWNYYFACHAKDALTFMMNIVYRPIKDKKQRIKIMKQIIKRSKKIQLISDRIQEYLDATRDKKIL